jgi:hypothetical protein
MYGWPGARLFSVMLIGVYAWVVSVRDDRAASFVLPALYPLPEASASTSTSASSAGGGSSTASIRPSPPTNRSGLSPNARITGVCDSGDRSDACPSGLVGTT